MTKWEKFAKAKGITKKKKDNLAWDDTSKVKFLLLIKFYILTFF